MGRSDPSLAVGAPAAALRLALGLCESCLLAVITVAVWRSEQAAQCMGQSTAQADTPAYIARKSCRCVVSVHGVQRQGLSLLL
jgi:hypothetical protein